MHVQTLMCYRNWIHLDTFLPSLSAFFFTFYLDCLSFFSSRMSHLSMMHHRSALFIPFIRVFCSLFPLVLWFPRWFLVIFSFFIDLTDDHRLHDWFLDIFGTLCIVSLTYCIHILPISTWNLRNLLRNIIQINANPNPSLIRTHLFLCHEHGHCICQYMW